MISSRSFSFSGILSRSPLALARRRILSHDLNYRFLCHAITRDFSYTLFINASLRSKTKKEHGLKYYYSSFNLWPYLSDIYETFFDVSEFACNAKDHYEGG